MFSPWARRASLLLALGVLASTIAWPVLAEGTRVLPIGQDRTLSGAELDVARILECEATRCSASTAQGRATSGVFLRDTTTTRSAESLVGWTFALARACDGQSTTAPFVLRYAYAYAFDADVPLLVQGSASHQVRARVFADDAAPVFVATAEGSGSGTLSVSAPVDITRAYEASVASRTTAAMNDVPLVVGEEVRGDGEAAAQSLLLDFTDPLAPEIDSITTQPASSGGGIGSFLGYVNRSPAALRVRAHDPAVDAGGAHVGQSCVKRIVADWPTGADVADPGFFQREVVVGSLWEEGSHAVSVTATDHQGLSTTEQVSLIVDSVPPANAIALTPAAPNGNAGWYKLPGGSWTITCVRDPEGTGVSETSPCAGTRVSRDGGATWQELGSGESFQLALGEGAAQTIDITSKDGAGNWNAPTRSSPVSFDGTRPIAGVERSSSSVYNNGWHRVPTTLVIRCAYDVPSGCTDPLTRVGSGEWGSQTTFGCEQELQMTIDFQVRDVAGNLVSGAAAFGCDFTPPSNVTNIRVATPTYENPQRGVTYSRVTPRIVWDPAADPVSGGVASGIHHYEVRVDGIPRSVTSPFFEEGSVPDGFHCYTVRAVDNANNRGRESPTVCLFVDREAPRVTYGLPREGRLYHNGQEIVVTGLPARTAVVIGPITTGATVTDPTPAGGEASDVQDVHLIEDLGVPVASGQHEEAPASCAPSMGEEQRRDGDCIEPCDDVNVPSVTCAWRDVDSDGFGPTISERLMFVRAWDNARNVAVAFRNYTKIELGVVEQACAQLWCNELLFEQTSVPDFLAYIIERRVPGHPILGSWTPIHTEPIAAQTSFQDLLHPTTLGETYEYRVHVQTEGNEIVRTTNLARVVAEHREGHFGTWEG